MARAAARVFSRLLPALCVAAAAEKSGKAERPMEEVTLTLRRSDGEPLGITVLERAVTKVQWGSVAAVYGLKKGMTLLSVAGAALPDGSSHDDVVAAVRAAPQSGGFDVRVLRRSPLPPSPNVSPLQRVDGVAELTDASWDTRISDGRRWFVEFYAPGCGFCKRVAKVVARVGHAVGAGHAAVGVAKVDATAQKQVAERYNITGYPSIYMFNGAEDKAEFSGGQRTTANFVEFIEKQAGVTLKPDPALIAIEEREDWDESYYWVRPDPVEPTRSQSELAMNVGELKGHIKTGKVGARTHRLHVSGWPDDKWLTPEEVPPLREALDEKKQKKKEKKEKKKEKKAKKEKAEAEGAAKDEL